MKKLIPFTYDGEVLIVQLGTETHHVEKADTAFRSVVNAIKSQDENKVRDALLARKKVKAVVDNKDATVEIRDGNVYYNGNLVVNALTKRIQLYLETELPVEPLVRFMENLMQNPSFNSRQELFNFLDHEGLPITEDGHFLGYKAVRENWMDKHSGKFSNKVGDVNEMPRADVDDNCNNGCSQGFHVGTFEYASSFGSGNDKLVLVKVNPRDAVSVPHDCSYQKLRVCRYQVVDVFTDRLADGVYQSEVNKTTIVAKPSTVLAKDMTVKNELRDYSGYGSDKEYYCEYDDEDEDDYDDWDDEDEDEEDEDTDEWAVDSKGRRYNRSALRRRALSQRRNKDGSF